jgi:hypothetical protein
LGVNEHEDIEELIAGYVLGSLSGEDARAADVALTEHVPECPSCRRALMEFGATAGELALAARPVAPPDLLLPMIQRDLDPAGRSRGARRLPALVAAAAGVVALLGLGTWNISLGVQKANVTERNALMQQALDVAARPDAAQVPLAGVATQPTPGSPAAASQPTPPMTEISAPGVERIYLVGRDLPQPGPGNVYRVWLGSGSSWKFAGEFLPEEHVTVLELLFDPTRFDAIVVTEEASGTPTSAPTGPERWSAAA